MVERRPRLSLQEFETEYVSKSRPVILTDATDHWPARQRWSLDYFEQHYGTKQVRVENNTWQIGPFIRDLKAHTGQGPVPYLKNVKLDEQFTELRADLGDLALARNNRLQSKLVPRSLRLDRGAVALFIGTKGSGFHTLHWDHGYLHVFISQIRGDKEVIAFHPEDARFLYPQPDQENLSRLPDSFDVDLEAFPAFIHARPIRFTVKQGETLFLPAGWWHATYIKDPALNIAIAESTLDHFNWALRADWYIQQCEQDGVSPRKLGALRLYLAALDQLLRRRERTRPVPPTPPRFRYDVDDSEPVLARTGTR